MRVLVTRPQPEADTLCRQLTAMGHTAIVDPLLSVEHLDFEVREPASIAATIVTSRNALRALERKPDVLSVLQSLPLFAVGGATAGLARELGFDETVEGPGNAQQLVPVIATRIAPSDGVLLSLAAEEKAFDLAGSLRAQGYRLSELTVYRTVAATLLRPGTLAALNSGALDAVILMSARTAAAYARLIVQHNQRTNIGNIAHLCLSQSVAEELSPLAPLIVRKAAYPNLEELLALAHGTDKPSA